MEKVRPWRGQPSDRGRLKNRLELARSCTTPQDVTRSAGLTMWQMWQMPRASGGPPEVEKKFSARQ